MKIISLILVASMTVLAACGGGDPGTESDAFGSPTITGAGLAPIQPDGADPAVGLPIPSVEGAEFDGTPVMIDPADGQAKVILFVAHWCSHCQAEVPAVQEALDGLTIPDGVELITVATSSDSARPNFPPSEWLEREGWTPPVIADSAGGDVANAFGLTAFPFWVIVGPDGTVLQRVAGSVSPDALPGMFDQLAAL